MAPSETRSATSTRAGRYVTQPAGYRAFIPAPLPPDPPVQITGDLQFALSEADRALGRLDGSIKTEPELDHLSNILKTFNDQFGNIQWTDADRVRKLITEEIPARVSADTAYQNAKKNSDRQNARIEHDKALARVIVSLMKDDTELFKQFSDNESFKKWLTDTVFTATYEPRPKT
jgi:type I restriction enzyme, R subunit